MRVAVISDVHGNALALEAVLEDIAHHKVDAILNLGDHFAGPLVPGRTARILAGLDMIAIRGNTDRYLLAHPDEVTGEGQEADETITSAPLEWLSGLPPTADFEGKVLLCHGSPKSDETYWLDRETGKRFRPATPAEIEAELPSRRYEVYCCGHTHIARVVTLADGRIVFNPGSVGRPSFNMSDPESAARVSPAAAYAILTYSAQGWQVDLRQVAYDHAAASAMARARGFDGWACDLAEGRKR